MKLYSTTTCGPCQTVKTKIEFEGYDIEIVQDPINFPDGVRSVPTLELDDGSFLVGAPLIMEKLREMEDG